AAERLRPAGRQLRGRPGRRRPGGRPVPGRLHPRPDGRGRGVGRGARRARGPAGGRPPGPGDGARVPSGAQRGLASAPRVPETGGGGPHRLKLRSASLRDLVRVEQIYREAEAGFSAVPPPARLWRLFSHTLAALLPLYQETLIYVAEDEGRVIGFIQATGHPLTVSLPAKISSLQ